MNIKGMLVIFSWASRYLLNRVFSLLSIFSIMSEVSPQHLVMAHRCTLTTSKSPMSTNARMLYHREYPFKNFPASHLAVIFLYHQPLYCFLCYEIPWQYQFKYISRSILPSAGKVWVIGADQLGEHLEAVGYNNLWLSTRSAYSLYSLDKLTVYD